MTGPLSIEQSGGKLSGRGRWALFDLSKVLLLFVLGTNESATFPTPAVNVSKSVTHS